ncbi:hotdog domain-containing protein [Rhodococcoides yunnanense]|uniref:hotdog domain-containing protein n=1 Tax=Rhodococcoides yunnanense TaxID=278209 RepID=UPI0009FEAA18|nr:hotdog domain-containing protein [Rhodococcus yunnanensis]
MYRSTLPLTHRPTREGTIVDDAHVPAYLALELATEAWASALHHASAGAFTAREVVIVNVASDFSRELLVGTVDVEVVVKRVGRSSVVVEVGIEQDGVRAAVASFTLVHVVDGVARPFTHAQRRILEVSAGSLEGNTVT